MNDEKTTEIELPKTLSTNIVRVNFIERRKTSRPPMKSSVQPSQAAAAERLPLVELGTQWTTPLWVRVAALLAILALSLFVL